VLLVDDDPEWGQVARTMLEETSDRLSVRFVEGATAALSVLDESDTAVDCIVCDYRMPDVDGLELLDIVRETHPTLPFVLVTAQGDEDVASEAISAGVTDYVIKDPTRDQSALLARRIETAVRNRRLRRAATESEERYRTVVKQSREGIYVAQGGHVVFVNERLTDLTGYAEADLVGADPVETFVHPADRERFRRVAAVECGGAESASAEVRLETRGGDVRTCETTGSRVAFDGEDAVLVSMWDVTERKRRERQLRQERDINRAVREVLVDSSRGEDIERAFCEEVVRHRDIAFAWVGGPTTDGSITPRAWAGDGAGYIEDVTLTAPEPSVRALRDGEPQFVESLADRAAAPGRAAAARGRAAAVGRGYRSVAAIPLEYQGVSHGVLAAYGETDAFDDHTRRLLSDLAEALAYAISTENRRAALTSDQVAEVRLDVADTDYYLVAVARAAGDCLDDDATLSVRDSVPREGRPDIEFVRLEGGDPDAVRAALADHGAVASATVLSAGDDWGRFRVAVDGPTVGAAVGRLGVALRDLTVRHGTAEVVCHVPVERDLRAVVDSIGETFDVNSMVSYRERDVSGERRRPAPDLPGDLTEKQREALQVAYRSGYFSQPRENSADEVAAALGISRSTFLQHLRVAQAKLLGSLFDAS
jgi:PAS domain S-box-containing protein